MNDKSLTFQQNEPTTAVVSIEQSRAVTEAQGAMIVAQKFPRDENKAYTKIVKACERLSLANTAIYSYKKGDMITGPSIRLAEVLARHWGNMTYGFREIGRDSISSEVEAFCWDMESNVRVTRTFSVKHWRDTKQGGYALKEERDKYELVANMAQRRVRACILEIIPGDIVDAAVEKCNETISRGDGRPIEDRVRDMIGAFQEFGVSQDNIVEYLGHNIEAVIPPELVKLQGIYKSLKDGVSTREEFFNIKETKKSKVSEAISKAPKKEKPNPLHATPEWKEWADTAEAFPEICDNMQPPDTIEKCLEAVKQVKTMVDQANA